MSDPTREQPTEEDIRAYLTQLREVPAAALIVQAFELFANAAQAKLGTDEARVLIDASERLIAGTEAQLEDAHPQIVSLIGQLKMAQVQAERARGARDAGAAPGEPGMAGAQPEDESQADQPQQKATDRLWIPGRD